MENVEPPTKEWWTNYWFLIFAGRPWTNTLWIPFLSTETKFRENWEFIRRAHRFYDKFVCCEVWYNPHVDDAFREEIDETFVRLGTLLTEDMNPSERQEFHDSMQAKLEDLAERVDALPLLLKPPRAPDHFNSPTTVYGRLLRKLRSWRVGLLYWIQLHVKELKIGVFERWKYRQPRIHPAGPLPADSIGNTYLR
jgi:hypothetical protein